MDLLCHGDDVVEKVNDLEVMITKQYVDTSGDHCIVHFTNKYNNNGQHMDDNRGETCSYPDSLLKTVFTDFSFFEIG